MQSHKAIQYKLLKEKTQRVALENKEENFSVRNFVVGFDDGLLSFIDNYCFLKIYHLRKKELIKEIPDVDSMVFIDNNMLLARRRIIVDSNVFWHLLSFPSLESMYSFSITFRVEYVGNEGDEIFFYQIEKHTVFAYNFKVGTRRFIMDRVVDFKISPQGDYYSHCFAAGNQYKYFIRSAKSNLSIEIYPEVPRTLEYYTPKVFFTENALIKIDSLGYATNFNVFSLDDYKRVSSFEINRRIFNPKILADENTLVAISDTQYYKSYALNKLVFIDMLTQQYKTQTLEKEIRNLVPLQDGSLLIVHEDEVQQVYLKHLENFAATVTDLCKLIPELIPDLVKIVFDYYNPTDQAYNKFTPNKLSFFRTVTEEKKQKEGLFSRCTIS